MKEIAIVALDYPNLYQVLLSKREFKTMEWDYLIMKSFKKFEKCFYQNTNQFFH